MALIIANENGDWWEFDPKDVLYILDTKDLPKEEKKEYKKYGTMDDFLIWEYGRPVSQSKLLEGNKDA